MEEVPNFDDHKKVSPSESYFNKEEDVVAEQEAVSRWFREMVAIKQQYTEDTLRVRREKFEKAVAEAGEGVTPEMVAGEMGVVPKSEYYEPNNAEEVALFGTTLEELRRRGEFEDWARKKGIEIPKFPGSDAGNN